MQIALSPEEKAILELGMAFTRLQNSEPYKKTLEWMDALVESAKADYETALRDASYPTDTVIRFGVRYFERRDFRNVISGRVEEIVNKAKELAEQIKAENEQEQQ